MPTFDESAIGSGRQVEQGEPKRARLRALHGERDRAEIGFDGEPATRTVDRGHGFEGHPEAAESEPDRKCQCQGVEGKLVLLQRHGTSAEKRIAGDDSPTHLKFR